MWELDTEPRITLVLMFLIVLRFNMWKFWTFGEDFAEPVVCLFMARLGELSNSPRRVDLHRSRGEQPSSP